MRKYILALILGCGVVLQYQPVFSQDYIEGNTYYDKNGRAYFYDKSGKAFYYPEPVAIEEISDNTKSADNNKVEDNKSDNVPENVPVSQTVDKNILADEALMKTITPEQLEKYISQGADVNIKFIRRVKNAQDENKIDEIKDVTPLMMAARDNENPEVIETLLKHGADVNAKDNDGATALMFAAGGNQNPEIIETLLKHGADIEAKKNSGFTALMFAAGNNQNPEIIETLLKHGADVNAKDEIGSTPLLYATVYHKNPEIIKVLLDAGADVNAYVENTISTAALFALGGQNPNHQVFEMLMEGEIDKFCRINSNYSADIYYCKDRLTNYMKKEHLLPSCTYDIGAMIGLTPVLQAMQTPAPGKGAYAFVVLAELTSQLNCSITNTFKELGIIDE